MSNLTFILFVLVMFDLFYNIAKFFLKLYDKCLKEYYKIDNEK